MDTEKDTSQLNQRLGGLGDAMSEDDANTVAYRRQPHQNSNAGVDGGPETVEGHVGGQMKEPAKNYDTATGHSNGVDNHCDTDRKRETDSLWDILQQPFDVTSWDRMVRLLCRPMDPALLGFCRFLFGVLMILDTFQERGMATADARWGDPTECRFPLIHGLEPLPLLWMYVVYMALLITSTGIMLGLAYRVCCPVYLCCYWYIFLLDKTSWNNHSYLFGILAFLFTLSDANRYWSVDALINPKIRNAHVPAWNYVLFRAQLFLVYFIAGLKKLDLDWVMGYSMTNLSLHWVFTPFTLIMTPEQVDIFVVHLGGLMIDLFVGFFLLHEKSRTPGLLVSSMFHIMNSQLFSIGMFPYGMLCMQIIFCSPGLPRKVFGYIPPALRLFTPDCSDEGCQTSYHCVYTKEEIKSATSGDSFSSPEQIPATQPNRRHRLVSAFTLAFIAWQCFLPFSHGITKGYNNWTNGMYGYSWDMMVHSWDVQHIRITYKDRDTNQSGYMDPMVWAGGSTRWSGHGDMIKQYAHCIQNNLKAYNLTNVELYFDIWRSLNHRFQQRNIDPRVNVLEAEWSPFEQASWMMPLIVNLTSWRSRIEEIFNSINENRTDENFTSAIFVADFPGLFLENYVHKDFGNTSLQVLDGQVLVEIIEEGKNYSLETGQSIMVPADSFHNVYTVSSTPSSYMYTFTNTTDIEFMEQLTKFQEDMHELDSVNKTLEKYSSDPLLPHYKRLIAQAEKDKMAEPTSLINTIKAFFWKKYRIFRRSIRLGHGALYCLATSSSFEEFLNATYAQETPAGK